MVVKVKERAESTVWGSEPGTDQRASIRGEPLGDRGAYDALHYVQGRRGLLCDVEPER